jgi:hypothetical protein
VTALSDLIKIAPRDVRAVDLEADAERTEPLSGYVISAHVIDALRQITVGWQDGARTRAWSVTGPYGAGKSAFVHLLQALHAPRDQPVACRANELLGESDAQLATTLWNERRRLGADRYGFMLALVRAQREPVADAITRALAAGAERFWAGRRAPTVLQELRNAAKYGLDADGAGEVVLTWTQQLAASAPILLVVDELGKVLEYAHSRSDDNDLFVLQQLAEWFSGRDRSAGGLLTLQHLAFEDYLAGVGDARRREWRKVQGRFADLPFVADAAHGHRLLAGALRLSDDTPKALRDGIARAAGAAEAQARERAGDAALPSAATGSPEATYPLHPLAATALPDLAARYGQHDRTLVAFLAGASPFALPAQLATTEAHPDRIPFVRLWQLYDAVVGDPQAAFAGGQDGARLREVRSRVEEQAGLSGVELQVAKTIAVLNLVAARRGLSADQALIEAACCGPANGPRELEPVREALDRLVTRGLIVWRDFAGEYRIWRGSDVDIAGVIAIERERLASGLDRSGELSLLAGTRPLRPEVARRHSVRQQVLRFFEARYATEVPSEPRCHMDGADGLILYVLGAEPAPSTAPAATVDGRPLVVVYTPYGREALDAVLDAAAIKQAVEASDELREDPVARREARHRAAFVRDAVADRLAGALHATRDGVCWFVAGKRVPAGTPVALSRHVSDLCDMRYAESPVLRSEMLNRRELTSQGAKARGEMLRAMFAASDDPELGLTGDGPASSMYRAVLQATGLHAARDGRWGFGPPQDETLRPAWDAVMRFFDESASTPRSLATLWQQLASPPYGLKDGPIPVIVAAGLLHREDDVFVYQDGSFVSTVTAAEVERLLKAPDRYAVKRAAILGLRASVFRELRDTLVSDAPSHGRNDTTLVVVRPLLAHLRALPEYTRRTCTLTQRTTAVRDALAAATEPDELLFSALPQACGVGPLPLEAAADVDLARTFLGELRMALKEMSAAYELLLSRVESLMRQALRVPRSQRSLRDDLRIRAAHLVEHVIDARGRGFLATACDDAAEDREWLEAVALNVAIKPMAVWTDHDADVFESLLAERAAWFHRLEALHADQRPQGPGAFSTRLVTVTAPDGRDARRLVGVDERLRTVMSAALDTVLASMRNHEDHPEDALLALLGERLLAVETADRPATELRNVS